jgi:internalin A
MQAIEADQAYAEAVRQCREAEATEAREVWFRARLALALEKLPPELSRIGSLQSLDLKQCARIRDLGPLAPLTALQRLDLTGCDQIGDLGPLAGVTSLRSLNLYGCNKIDDLGPLAGLSSLRSLYLSACELISDLGPLAGLTSLRLLSLYWCKQVRDFRPLAELTSLKQLDLSGCETSQAFSVLEALLPRLEELRVAASRFPDLPAEICGDLGENVLDKVRGHFRDLRSEASRDTEVRVLVLGNGGVGKTQLCRRLSGLEFDESVSSTHGIELGAIQMELENPDEPVQLNLWDFGGQDIYHGSHTLFLQGHAVFLILWTPRLEDCRAYEESGLALRHRPLAYWIDYIRAFAGTNSAVVVVQSQCDTPGKRASTLPAGLNDEHFWFVHRVAASAKTGLGLGSVKEALKEAVRDLLFRRPLPPIGGGRVRVRQRLREMLQTERKRWLERTEFEQVCAEEGGISDTEALLDFLHHGGVVFYRPGLFGGRIVIDQNWALEAIYSIFDRRKCLPLQRSFGRFSRSDLDLLVWQKFSQEEQKVFLGMMRSCRICFRVRDDEYIAPELLPTWPEARDSLLAGRLLGTAADAEAQANFGFLHEGVLRSYFSVIGQQAGDAAIYWQYGCWFYEKTTDSRALIESRWENAETETGPGVIHFRAWGQRARALVEPLVKALDQVTMGQRPTIRWTEAGARPDPSRNPGDLSKLQIVETIHAPSGKPAMYVSYAWHGIDVVDGLCQACESEGWEVFRDKKSMRYGDRISAFMKSISRADLILVVISEKYLRSPYCMAELHGIYQRSLGEKDDFLERVIPFTLEDVKIGTVRDRLAHAKHWRAEFQAIEADLEAVGAEDFRLYKSMKSWHNDVSDMLAALSDVLSPQGFEAIVADNYKALRTMLKTKSTGQ